MLKFNENIVLCVFSFSPFVSFLNALNRCLLASFHPYSFSLYNNSEKYQTCFVLRYFKVFVTDVRSASQM
jgi:hypothetical protein